ncbi:finger 511-like [Octopus vulgaris]|nr:finger 511-like [Octopus vulgaris]
MQHKPFSCQWNPKKRHLLPGDSLFEDGDIFCNLLLKQMSLADEEFINKVPEFPCGMAGCQKTFNNLVSYECHYNSLHRNTCATCRRIFPSSYLLGLHIQEWHDVMFDIMSGKKPMFSCLLEACGQKFQTSQDRKEHMIKCHKYPANFRFDKQKNKCKSVTAETEDKTESKVDNMEITTATATPPPPTTTTTTTTTTTKKYNKIPKNICFGKGSVRTFHKQQQNPTKHWHQQFKTEKGDGGGGDIEEVTMTDLMTALEETS